MKVFVLTLINLSAKDTGLNGEYNQKVFSTRENAEKTLREWVDEEAEYFKANGQDVDVRNISDWLAYLTLNGDEGEGEIFGIEEHEVE